MIARSSRFRPFAIACCLLLAACGRNHAADPRGRAKQVRSLAIKWLVRQQHPEDGSYGKRDRLVVGRTALVVWVLATCERGYQVVDGPYMSEAVDFLLKHYRRDGSFGRCEDARATRFNTAMAACALASLKSGKKYRRHVARALGYLAATRPAGAPATLEGGLGALWPERPGAVTRLLLSALLRVGIRQGGAWLHKAVDACARMQERKDDESDDYGKCSLPGSKGLEADPVVVSALAAKIVDLVKANYKRLVSTAPAGDKAAVEKKPGGKEKK